MLRKKEKEHKQEKSKDNVQKLYIIAILFIFTIQIFNLSYYSYKCFAAESNTPAQSSPQKEGSKTTEQNELDLIEEKVFHEKYSSDPQEARVSRLEEFVFGKKQSNETIEQRIKKINNAINPKEQQETQKTEIKEQNTKESSPVTERNESKQEYSVIYDESFNVGVVGAINQIETKVFSMSFNNLPFPVRVAKLEETLLSKSEILKNRKKPLMERVNKLVQKAGVMPDYQAPQIQLPKQPQPSYNYAPPQNYQNQPQSYSIDPNTGYLINDQTKEIVKDNLGNPISVTVPKQNLNQQGIPPNYYNNQNLIPPQYPQQGYPGNTPYNNQNFIPPQYPQQGYPNNNPSLPTHPGFPQTQIPFDLLFDQENQNNDPGD